MRRLAIVWIGLIGMSVIGSIGVFGGDGEDNGAAKMDCVSLGAASSSTTEPEMSSLVATSSRDDAAIDDSERIAAIFERLHTVSKLGRMNTRFEEQFVTHAHEGICDRENNTLLHVAARHGHLNLVRELVLAGMDINARNKENQTPLHVAATFKHAQIVQFLIGHQADASLLNVWNQTALDLAKAGGDAAVIFCLTNHPSMQSILVGMLEASALHRRMDATTH